MPSEKKAPTPPDAPERRAVAAWARERGTGSATINHLLALHGWAADQPITEPEFDAALATTSKAGI